MDILWCLLCTHSIYARLLLSEKCFLVNVLDSSFKLYFNLWKFLSSLSLLYAMDNKRCFLFNVSLSTHFRRQLLQNLGLEVYPMSYSTHFWFALWYFIYYKYYYYDMPIGCLKNQTTVAIGRQFHLVQSE